MRLGGWTRLWVFLSALWLVIVGAYTVREVWLVSQSLHVVASTELDKIAPVIYYYPRLRIIRDGALAWLVPTLVIFALGHGVRWVANGFKRK